VAKTWLVQGTRADVQVLSPTEVQDVQRISAVTVPHNVWFEVLVPRKGWLQGDIDRQLLAISGMIETIIDHGTATDATYVEDLDVNGLVQSYIEFVIEVPAPSPSQVGSMTTTVRVPYGVMLAGEVGGNLVGRYFDAARAALTATAAQ